MLKGGRFERLAEIVVHAAELPPEERAAYLESACGDDASLRSEAEGKLAFLEADPSLLRTHGVQQHLGFRLPSDAGLPETVEWIGPFRVTGVLGSGGMGIVYEAEQTEPIERTVAIKLIRVGMDTEEVIARFSLERQSLALMNHPNIARVLDAGATESGRPYFVMERVSGIPITEYSDQHRLSVRERLGLFLPVCQAVQHAHQKGIVHRDLKPSNILVSTVDGVAVPKVIDFGIAKAVRSGMPAVGHTSHGQVIGTPEYMSPEQARGGELAVDTRTDVYSLGVVLYELLTGVLPFDQAELREGSLGDIRRVISESEPAKPSSRVSGRGGRVVVPRIRRMATPESPVPLDSEATATVRRTDRRSLRRELSGDLDWIVLRAMAKDPSERYDSAAELGRDLTRTLQHEAIAARPPSRTYRLRKLVRRHRVSFGFASSVAALVIGFGVWMGMLYQRAEANLSRALDAEVQAARESRTAREVSAFLIDLFEVSDPGTSRGNTITAREILDRGAAEIEAGLADEPAVQATMMGTVGVVYRKLGLFADAEPFLRRALETLHALADADPLAIAQAQFDLGSLYATTGRIDDARTLLDSALTTRTARLGASDASTVQATHALATLRWEVGEKAEAEQMLRGALEQMEASPADFDDAAVADVLDALAVSIATQGRVDESAPYFERALKLRETSLGPDHPEVALSYSNLGMLYREQKRFEESAEAMRRSLQIRERVLGPDHTEVAASLNNLGIVEDNLGAHAEAEPHHLRALEIRERALGPDHPLVGESLVNLAFCRSRLDPASDTVTLYLRALSIYEGAYGPDHPVVANVLNDLGYVLERKGRDAEALPYRERTLRLRESLFGAESPAVSNTLVTLAKLRRRLGSSLEETQPLLERALAIRETAFGPDAVETADVRRELEP